LSLIEEVSYWKFEPDGNESKEDLSF